MLKFLKKNLLENAEPLAYAVSIMCGSDYKMPLELLKNNEIKN